MSASVDDPGRPIFATSTLAQLGIDAQQRFAAQRSVLSFSEYLDLVAQQPWQYSRDAARYLAECFDYFGAYEESRPYGVQRRWRLFDLEFSKGDKVPAVGRRHDMLIGHERVQQAFYHSLRSFVREGRANRLVLMHGPNGSSKTTFAACVMRALEHYSRMDDGALYRFSWIFPRSGDAKGIGFAAAGNLAGGASSYAHLSEDRIEAKMQSELRENPLLLLPIELRRECLERFYRERGVVESPADNLWHGDLSGKNRQVFDALLTAYRGDVQRVLAHVQVERYYISRRYRVGAVTIGPQMAVDARERQITASYALHALPASLSALTLYEPFGELVDGSGGVVEFSDLLKRPLEAWKYLLLAIENGEVPLEMSNLPINAVLMASSNELHLEAFRGHADFNSFRGRLHFVRVPYLLDYVQEQSIYDKQIAPQIRGHVAPHATFVAALWAVLTRLRRADPQRYDNSLIGRLAADLTPLEKADLYALGTVASRLSLDESKELANNIAAVYDEPWTAPAYEGVSGASPREVRAILLDALHDKDDQWLSPLAVLHHIEAFCQRNDYEFLQQRPESGYYDHRGFIKQVRKRWLDRVDEQVQICAGLVDDAQQVELFDRYVTHVSVWVKGERVLNRVTGKSEEPDAELMRRIEEMLEVKERREEFRRDLISSVAGYSISHPGEPLEHWRIFPQYFERIRQAYFRERFRKLAVIVEDVVKLLRHDPVGDAARAEQAKRTAERLQADYGFDDRSALEAVGELWADRYTL